MILAGQENDLPRWVDPPPSPMRFRSVAPTGHVLTRMVSLRFLFLVAFSTLIGPCALANAQQTKSYRWDFTRPSNENFAFAGSVLLPDWSEVPITPSFGSDVTLPRYIALDRMRPGRSYAPTATLWSKFLWADKNRVTPFSRTDFTFRYSPSTDLGDISFGTERDLDLSKRFRMTFRDVYTLSAPDMMWGQAEWSTTKSLSFALNQWGTSLSASLSSGEDDNVWHAGFSASQKITGALALNVSMSDLQNAKDRESLFEARFTHKFH